MATDIRALTKEAETLRSAGALAEARALYRQILDEIPNEQFALLGLGICAHTEGQYEEALTHHQRAQAHHPKSIWPHVEAAKSYFALNRLDDAEAACRNVLAIKPGELNSLRGMVRLARARGDDVALAAALDALPEQTPQTILERAQFLARTGKSKEALALLAEGAAAHPEHPGLLIESARILRATGDLDGAIMALEAAYPLDTQNPTPLIKLSDIARTVQRPDMALDYLALARETCRKDIWADLCYAQSLFELGRYEECFTTLEAALERHNGHFLVYQVRAELHAKRGDFVAARAISAQGLAAHPNIEALILQAAELAAKAGEPGQAARCAAPLAGTQGAEVKPRLLTLLAELAEDGWRQAEAAEYYRRLEALQPDSRPALVGQMRIALVAGDLTASRAKLEKYAGLEKASRLRRGLSANVSQSFWGQYHEEFTFEPEVIAQLRILSAEPAAIRVPALAALVQSRPDLTPTACSLLLALREAGMLDATAAVQAAASPIPNLIIQYWHSPTPPADVASLMASWQRANPGWAYHCFHDNSARVWLAQNDPEALPAYLAARLPAQRSDMFRLSFLSRRGGWYADADDLCQAPLAGLPIGSAGFVGYQEEFATIGNNILGARAAHPVIEEARLGAIIALNRRDSDIPWLSTGPGLLSRAFAKSLVSQEGPFLSLLDDIAILSKPALRRVVTPHCQTRYKLSGEHWTDDQFRKFKLLRRPQGVPEGTVAGGS